MTPALNFARHIMARRSPKQILRVAAEQVAQNGMRLFGARALRKNHGHYFRTYQGLFRGEISKGAKSVLIAFRGFYEEASEVSSRSSKPRKIICNFSLTLADKL